MTYLTLLLAQVINHHELVALLVVLIQCQIVTIRIVFLVGFFHDSEKLLYGRGINCIIFSLII